MAQHALARKTRKSEEEVAAAAEPSTTLLDESVPARKRRRFTPSGIAKDLLRPSRAQALLGLILCLCAMGTVWQIRSKAADDEYSSMRRADLVQMLDQLNSASAKLRNDIAQLEETKRQLQSGVDSKKVAENQAKQRLAELQILAGTAPAQGPGIVLTITDPQGNVSPELLLDAIEEMRDAGAEAIMINESLRIVATSWFARGPQGVIVDGVAIKAPYTLTIIGEPHALEEGARFRGGLVSQAQAPTVGATVSIVQSQKLTITALYAPKAPQFARPA